MPDLAPCPFCGSAELKVMGEAYKYVHCMGCMADGPMNDEPHSDEWLTRWNAAPRHEKEQTPSLRSGGEG